jgi:hypothetical protein
MGWLFGWVPDRHAPHPPCFPVRNRLYACHSAGSTAPVTPFSGQNEDIYETSLIVRTRLRVRVDYTPKVAGRLR